MEPISLFVIFSIFASALGVSWVSRDYLSSLIGGLIIRRVKHINPGTRIKILGQQVVKGDILHIGLFRTLIAEVGTGGQLTDIRTGNIYLVPNFIMINSPILMYGRKLMDQVVAYVDSNPEEAACLMQEAMKEAKVKIKEVDVYQSKEKFIIYGIYEPRTKRVSNVRNEILEAFVSKVEKNRKSTQ